MKCNNCRSRNADAYVRITGRHDLFETFQGLNPNRFLNNEDNSYVCQQCVTLATNLKYQDVSLLSSQQAHTVSHLQISKSPNHDTNLVNSREIALSKSDNGSKRRANTPQTGNIQKPISSKRNKPCPKSRRPGSKSKSDAKATTNINTSQTESSQSLQEGNLFLNIVATSSSEEVTATSLQQPSKQTNTSLIRNRGRIQYDSESETANGTIPSVESPVAVIRVPDQSGTATAPPTSSQEVSSYEIILPSTLRQPRREWSSSENVSLTKMSIRPGITGATAPASKKPRIRNYFDHTEQEINVNDYPRLSAG